MLPITRFCRFPLRNVFSFLPSHYPASDQTLVFVPLPSPFTVLRPCLTIPSMKQSSPLLSSSFIPFQPRPTLPILSFTSLEHFLVWTWSPCSLGLLRSSAILCHPVHLTSFSVTFHTPCSITRSVSSLFAFHVFFFFLFL